MRLPRHPGPERAGAERNGPRHGEAMFPDVHHRDGFIRITEFMPLLDQVQRDMTGAMKTRDEMRLSALRMLKTALKKQEVDP